MQRTVTSIGLLFAAILICASPAHAQQTVNFTIGHFAPVGFDARVSDNGVTDDVIAENASFLVFDLDDFGGASFGGEWLIPLGNFFEAGAGVSYTAQTVASFYEGFVDPDGTEVDQDLRLRMLPLAFTVRLVAGDPRGPVQPYIGAGLGLINWRYSETGEFIDFGAGNVIFRDSLSRVTENWLPPTPVTIGMTAGASCPNNLIEETIIRVFELHGIGKEQLG